MGGADVGLQRIDVRNERHQPLLQLLHTFELVLRIGHLRRQLIARGLQHIELGSPRELFLQLLIDVAAHRVQAIEAAFELFDERQAGGHARDVGVELGDRLVQLRRLLRPFLDERHLAEDRLHLGFELGRPRRHRGHPVAEGLEREAVGPEPVAQLRDLGV